MPLCWHDRPADSPDTQKMIWCFGMLSVIPSRNFSEETKAQELLGFLSGVFKVSDWLLKKMTISGHKNSFEFSCQNDSFHDCIIQSWNLASNDLNSLRWPQQPQMTSKCLKWPQKPQVTSIASNAFNSLRWPQQSQMTSKCIKWPQNVSNDLKMSQMTSKASIASNDLNSLKWPLLSTKHNVDFGAKIQIYFR